MQKSSEKIAEYVFLTTVRYTKMQNKTKEIFFKYLEENKSSEEFGKEISKIWDNINHTFMDQQIRKLQKQVKLDNVTQAVNLGRMNKKALYKQTEEWVIGKNYFRLTPESEFIKFEQKYKQNVIKNYERYQTGIDKYGKDYYLSNRIDDYNKNVNQVVTYFSKEGLPLRKVQLSTYLSMLHNTDLTRATWNQTMSDAQYLGKDRFIIPYHPFSCSSCFEKQNRPLSLIDVENMVMDTELISEVVINGSASGDILHPNCKCTLDIYWSDSQIGSITYSPMEIEKQYKIRQKINGLTLERSNLRTDIKIATDLGNFDKVDKYKARVSAINRNIRELRNELPTDSLKKQVTAIKR